MEWNEETAALLTRVTARLSAASFAIYLAAHAMSRLARWRGPHYSRFFGVFVIAHTVHFGAVLSLAAASGGQNIADRGGWAVNLGVLGTFYAAALLVVRRQGRRRGGARERVRATEIAVVSVIWVVFSQAYLLRLTDSLLFVVLGALLSLSFAAWVVALVRTRRRRPDE